MPGSGGFSTASTVEPGTIMAVVTTRWTNWTGALAWAEALTDWDRVVNPEQWPEDGTEQLDAAGNTMLLLAHAIQAAAILDGYSVTTGPDDIKLTRLAIVAEFLTPQLASNVLYAAEELGPHGDSPGGGTQLARLMNMTSSASQASELFARTISVVRAHRSEIDPNDSPVFLHTLADRREAVTLATQQLYGGN